MIKPVSRQSGKQVGKQAGKHLGGIQSEPCPVGACFNKNCQIVLDLVQNEHGQDKLGIMPLIPSKFPPILLTKQ